MPQNAPILVSCNCGYSLQAPAEYAGQRIQCPNCGDPVLIPAPFSPRPTPATSYSPTSTSAPWVIVGVVCTILVGVIIFALVKKSGQDDPSDTGTAGTGGSGGTGTGPDKIARLLDWPTEFPPLQPGDLKPAPTQPHDPSTLATPFPVEGEFIRSAPLVGDGPIAAITINDDDADRFDFFELATGEKIASIPKANRETKLLDLSPDGGRVAIAENDEVTIYGLPSGQIATRFKPIGEQKIGGEIISQGWFIGDQRFLLRGNNSNLFGLWHLGTKSWVWVHKVPGYGDLSLAITPDRKSIIASNDGKLIVFDVISGAVKGTLPAPKALADRNQHVWRDVHFSPDGTLMAATFGLVTKNVPVAVWNLPEASLVGEFEIQQELYAVLDDKYLLIGKYAYFWLYDMHASRDVWMILAKCEPEVFSTHGGQPWFVSTTTSDPNRYLTTAAIDPAKLLASTKEDDTPPILDAGSQISLAIKGDAPSDDSDFADRIERAVSIELARKEFEVAPGQDITCNVIFTMKDTGKMRHYSKDGIVASGGVEIPERQLHIDTEIRDGSGKSLWRNNHTIYPARFVEATSPDEIAAYILKEQWADAEARIPLIRFPPRLWNSGPLGSSQLTKDGFKE